MISPSTATSAARRIDAVVTPAAAARARLGRMRVSARPRLKFCGLGIAYALSFAMIIPCATPAAARTWS